ncbi:hypothetical protein EON64_03480, partial [archaeon]
MMGVIFSVLYFASFLSGTVFGMVIAAVALLHFLSVKPTHIQELHDKKEEEIKQKRADIIHRELKAEEKENLTKVIDYLDEVNSPLKTMGGILQRIHQNKEQEAISLESKMKTIIDYNTLMRLEREFQDNLGELKDHSKQLKLIHSFLNDMGKAYFGISKDLSKLAHSARNQLLKSGTPEKREDLIVNTWWQSLLTSLDHLASDQETFSTVITDELMGYASQIQEEFAIIDKRLFTEGSKQFLNLKDNLSLFESRLKEREKMKEKVRAFSVQSLSDKDKEKNKRKYKQTEEALVQQTKKLYDVQKEFYSLLPRIHSDVQLTVLKSIIGMQSQLFKLTDALERSQVYSQNVCKRMKTQLG